MGFETAVLYRKYGLRELELHRYELVFPESITPLDSLGAIIIYGEYPDGEGGCSKGTVIYPIDDYTYYNHIVGNIMKMEKSQLRVGCFKIGTENLITAIILAFGSITQEMA